MIKTNDQWYISNNYKIEDLVDGEDAFKIELTIPNNKLNKIKTQYELKNLINEWTFPEFNLVSCAYQIVDQDFSTTTLIADLKFNLTNNNGTIPINVLKRALEQTLAGLGDKDYIENKVKAFIRSVCIMDKVPNNPYLKTYLTEEAIIEAAWSMLDNENAYYLFDELYIDRNKYKNRFKHK